LKITEIIKNIYCYAATIRAKHGKSTTTAKTLIWANGIREARALLTAAYGDGSVVSVCRVNDDQLSEAVSNGTKRWRKPRVLPTTFKHDIAQQELLNQIKHDALRVKPTVDDLRAAQDEFDVQQKRVNRDYTDKLKWAEIRQRRVRG
jgi:hypothetical protein